MKRILILLLAAIAVVACEKDNLTVDDPKDNGGASDPPVVRMEWNIPANLPEDIVEIIAGVPCWKPYHIGCGGKVEDGKAVIEDVSNYRNDGDGRNQTYKFHKTMDYDMYWYHPVPNYSEYTQHDNGKWSKMQILEYKEGKIIFAIGDLTTEGSLLSIRFLEAATQERLDEMIANLPNGTDK